MTFQFRTMRSGDWRGNACVGKGSQPAEFPREIPRARALTTLFRLDADAKLCSEIAEIARHYMDALPDLLTLRRNNFLLTPKPELAAQQTCRQPCDAVPNRLLGAATLDRLRHVAYRLTFEGESHRALKPLSAAAPSKRRVRTSTTRQTAQ